MEKKKLRFGDLGCPVVVELIEAKDSSLCRFGYKVGETPACHLEAEQRQPVLQTRQSDEASAPWVVLLPAQGSLHAP